MTTLNNTQLPGYLYEPLQAVENAQENEAEHHKKLLDLGESILHYISGILLGEYKKTGEVNLKIESEFYKHSKRMPSLGVFQGFVRLLIQEQRSSILMEKFDKDVIFERSAELVFSYELLKIVIDKGADSGFEEKITPLRKQRSRKDVGLLEFFDCFVQIRNTYAHPEEKAGPKHNKRKWPLTDEYYNYINNKLDDAFQEILESLDILINYPYGTTAEIIDEQKQSKLLIEQGSKKKEITVNLTDAQLKAMSLDEQYLLDENGSIYSRLFYHKIPALNPDIATEVMAKEKKAQILPHLKQLIRDKLSDDHRIDAIEYMVLWDTARMASYPEAQLFELIDTIRKELKIDADIGTPENKGPLFIEKHEGIKRLSFSPYWLKHFLWVQKISIADQQKEKEDVNRKYDANINKLQDALKSTPGGDKIKTIENSMRSTRDKLKTLRASRREIPSKFKPKINSARTEERKESLKQERLASEQRIDARIEAEVQKLEEQRNKLEALKQKQLEQQAGLKAQLEELIQQKEADYASTTWGIHSDMWKEFDQYVDGLLQENLNNEESTDESEETEQLWVNNPNSWQIGNLSHYYWAKIYQSNAPLGMMRHIGFWIGKNFRWVSKNIPENDLKNRINDNSVVLWTSSDDKLINRIESSRDIFIKYSELCQPMVNNNAAELLKLGLNVKCVEKSDWVETNEDDGKDLFTSLAYYLENLSQTHQIKQLYSRIYTLPDLYKGGKIDLSAIADMENEIQALMSLFANILNEINDYAISIGLNQEEIKKREEQFQRYKKIMFKKFGDSVTSAGFNPAKEQIDQWKSYAKEEFDLNEYSFNEIYSSFRWKSGK
jgi:hypothetical protein